MTAHNVAKIRTGPNFLSLPQTETLIVSYPPKWKIRPRQVDPFTSLTGEAVQSLNTYWDGKLCDAVVALAMACVSAIERGKPPDEDLYLGGYQEVKVDHKFDVFKDW